MSRSMTKDRRGLPSLGAGLIILLLGAAGCAWMSNNQMSQAQLKNFETRTIDAPFERVYAAATEALFDLGYQISHSEKASGIIVGQKSRTDTAWVRSPLTGRLIAQDKLTTLSLTLLIKPLDKKSSDVRMKSAVDGQPVLSKGAIDQVWLHIDRQVLMEGPAPTEKTPSR